MTNGWKSVGWLALWMVWNFVITIVVHAIDGDKPSKEKVIFLSCCWVVAWFAWQLGELRREIGERKL